MEWAKSTGPEILMESLKAGGYQVSQAGNTIRFSKAGTRINGYFNAETCKMVLQNAEDGTESEMKVNYSKRVVETQAKRFGWQGLEWKTNAAGNPVATVKRRA